MKLTAALLLVLSCTALACNAQDLRRTDAAKAACGPFDEDFSSPSVPASGRSDNATVYIIQIGNVDASCLGNCGPKSRIGMDGKWIGLARGKSVVKADVIPGAHHLCASWSSPNKKLSELVALHSLEVDPGHSYYFGLDVIYPTNLGGGFVQYALRPLDADEARMLIAAYPEASNAKR